MKVWKIEEQIQCPVCNVLTRTVFEIYPDIYDKLPRDSLKLLRCQNCRGEFLAQLELRYEANGYAIVIGD